MGEALPSRDATPAASTRSGATSMSRCAQLVPVCARFTAVTTITADTALLVSYRNLGATTYPLVFAVDATGDLHWIAPVYLSAATDLSSLALSAGTRHRDVHAGPRLRGNPIRISVGCRGTISRSLPRRVA
jgi:hypothetical protein